MNQSKKISSSTVFCFPSETTVSFIILIISALFVAVNIGQNIERTIQVIFEKPGEETGSPLLPGTQNNDENSNGLSSQHGSILTYAKPLVVPLISALLLFAVTTMIFLQYPNYLKTRSNYNQIDSEKLFEFHQYVQNVSSSLIKKPPEVLITNSLMTANAQAFGTGIKNFLKLDGGLRLLQMKSKRMFDAILHHELGHIINKDVAKTYFSVSIWYAVIGIFALPLIGLLLVVFYQGVILKLSGRGINIEVLSEILMHNLPQLLKAFAQMFLLFGTVVFFRNNVLKFREYFADLRADTFGYKDELLNILSRVRDKKRSVLDRIKSYHPTSAERIAILQDSSGLFSISLAMSFFAGVLQSFIVNGLFFPLLNFGLLISVLTTPGLDSGNLGLTRFIIIVSLLIPFLIIFLASPLLALPVSGSIGLQSMKSSYSSSFTNGAHGIAMKDYLLVPLLFIVGNEIGYLLQPISNLAPDSLSKFLLIILSHAITFSSLIIIMLTSAFAGRKISKMDPINKNFRRTIYGYLSAETIFFATVMIVTVFVRLMIVLNFWDPLS
jgi:Zn-dependent protease with chaperone function